MLSPPDSKYSGILECPCNSRYGGDAMFYPEGDGYGHKTKLLEDKIMAIESGTCVALWNGAGQRVAIAST